MTSIRTNQQSTPVLLLTGYLGSGKTTLLNRILNNKRGIRFAVIVNDLGEVNIDAALIREGGIVGQQGDDDLVALQNGCICCTLRADLIQQITQLIDTGDFDYIVIEASGICEPEPIAQTICTMQAMAAGAPGAHGPRLDCIVTVVDALRLKTDFGGGDDLTRKDIDEEDIENLVIQQIEFCNIILLNKISEVTREEAGRIRAVVRALQPKAEIIECDYCDVDLDRLLDTHLFNFERTITSATWVQEIERPVTAEQEAEAHGEHTEESHEHHHDHDHEHDHDHHHEHEHHHDHEHHEHGEEGHVCDAHCHHHHHHHHGEGEAEEYGIGTFVYYRRAPFDFGRFDNFCARLWPKNIIRSKGVLYFSHNRDMSLLFEQAGVQKNLTEAGKWYATAPEEDRRMLMEQDPNFARDWDPVYGDRMIKLVFIGRDLDREGITKALDACLVKE